MIRKPFASYPRAKLERFVQEGFERIEREAVRLAGATSWGTPSGLPMDPHEFQILTAAEYYLRNTKES